MIDDVLAELGDLAPGFGSLSPAVAERYAGKTDKTLTRDLDWLLAEDLIERRADGYRARLARMRSFLPPRAAPA